MPEHILDASAVLAVLNREKGWERVEATTDRYISAVNLAEAASILAHRGYDMDAIAVSLAALRLSTVDFDHEQAFEVARLRPLTRAHGLSLGDRACLALGGLRNSPVITTERVWQQAAPHIEVIQIR
jgi:PIN domain nuclease of toxin-antitoxin system